MKNLIRIFYVSLGQSPAFGFGSNGSGGGGGGLVAANNGLMVIGGTTAILGNPEGQTDAVLTSDRFIPLDAFTVNFVSAEAAPGAVAKVSVSEGKLTITNNSSEIGDAILSLVNSNGALTANVIYDGDLTVENLSGFGIVNFSCNTVNVNQQNADLFFAFNIVAAALGGSTTNGALQITQTWNTSGTPSLITANVTDTASNAASLLLDLQVANTSVFKIVKNGNIVTAGNITTAQPSVNGPGAWKLGKVITAPVVLDATRYAEVDIDGVVLKVALAT